MEITQGTFKWRNTYESLQTGKGAPQVPRTRCVGCRWGCLQEATKHPLGSSPENDADSGTAGVSDELLKIRRKTYREGVSGKRWAAVPLPLVGGP